MLVCTKCHHEVKPVVALDLDGTMTDYHGSLFRFGGRWLGTPRGVASRWSEEYDGSLKLARFMGLTDETYRAMKLAYRQGGNKRFQPVMGNANALVDSLRAAGAEVWITTTRPYNRFDSTDPDTREWLRRHDIQYDGLIYDDDKYARLVEIVGRERIVGVLDDLPECYDRAAMLGLEPIQRGTKYNRAVRRPVVCTTLTAAQDQLIYRIEQWKDRHG